MSCHVSCFEIVQEEPIRIRSFLFENAAIIYSERAFAWKDGDSFDFFLLFFLLFTRTMLEGQYSFSRELTT